ncbi:MAG: hypothetical protein LBP55_05920, partial [Candidatus Adiutrix sp.]|nr:hypothetical protein [Candidatus Adiutrix sp.]
MTDPKSSPPVEEELEELAPLGENKADDEITALEPPLSQAALDIQAAARQKEAAPREAGRGGVENLAKIARFRWLVLLTLSLASVAAWTVEAFWSERPYHWPALELFVLTLVLALLTAKFLRLPTRSGLAAWCWSGTFLISAIYGPPETFFSCLPAALVWSGLLTLIMLWMGVAIWRKLGRYKVIDLLLSLFLIFGALSPILALVDNIRAGEA